MFKKTPNLGNWIFDTNIQINRPVNRQIQRYPISKNKVNKYKDQYNLITNKFNTILFKNINKSLQLKILTILSRQFGNKLDITNNTKIHYLINDNKILAIASSELDEVIGDLFRKKGYKDMEGLGIRSNGVYLYNLWINPLYRNKGLAKKMINYIENYYNTFNKQSIRVQVNDINKISLRLFIKLGYLEESRYLSSNNVQVNLSKWLN